MEARPNSPPSVITAAVLLLIYGGLLLVCGMCGAGGGALGMAMQDKGGDQARIQAMMDKDAPGHQFVQWGSLALNFLVAFMIIGAGIGVLRWSPIGRMTAYLGIVLDLLVSCGSNIYQIVFIMPVTEKFLAEAMLQQQKQGGPPPPFDIGALATGAGIFGVVLVVVVKLGFLVPAAICLNTAGARAAFSGQLKGPPSDDDRDWGSRSSGYDDGYNPPSPPRSPGDTGITDRS